MRIRVVAAASACAATLFVAYASGAASAQAVRPQPEPVTASTACDLFAATARLMDDERRAAMPAERRLIHREHVQLLRDGEC